MVLEALSAWVYSSPAITGAFFIIVYCVIGFFLKYIDAAFDDDIFNKKKAFWVAVILAALGATAMAISPTTTIIFAALIFGLIVARKVDNTPFILGVFICFIIFFVLGGTINPILHNPQAFLILFLAAMIEDRFDYKKQKLFRNGAQKMVSFLFKYGFLLKISAIIVFIFMAYEPLFCIALILFDFSYDAMLLLTQKKLGKKLLWG